MPGLFIVLYGINNLGKSTQAKRLTERLQQAGYHSTYLKYPIYDLTPSGPLINGYLRGGNPHSLSAREVQTLYAMNRTQFEPELSALLEKNVHVVAEDYTGTGMSWGIGAGVDPAYLKEVNSHLRKENIAFLFDGERFTDATEQGHKHETDTELLTRVREAHQALGREEGWHVINANQQIEVITDQLFEKVQVHLSHAS